MNYAPVPNADFWVAVAAAAPVVLLAHAVLFERVIRTARLRRVPAKVRNGGAAVYLLVAGGFAAGWVALLQALNFLRAGEAGTSTPGGAEVLIMVSTGLIGLASLALAALPKDP